MRRLCGLLVVLFVLAGCSERVGGASERTEPPTGAADLSAPIELARVAPTAGPGTTELPDPDGTTLHVEEPFLTITRLEQATAQLQQTTWGLAITLTEDDGKVFSRWTEEHTGEQVAMIVDDEIVSAPVIQQAIPGREVSISGSYTKSEAEALLHKITGR
ncbi:SecDF P1 head subdomain-containing protein [Actinophytocola sediminis]